MLTRSRLLCGDLAGLAMLLLNMLQPGFRNLETQGDREPLFARIARGQNLAAKLRVLGLHRVHLLEGEPQRTDSTYIALGPP